MAEMTGSGNMPLIPGGLGQISADRESKGLARMAEETAVSRPAARSPHPVAASRHPSDIVLRGLAGASASAVLLLLLILIVVLVKAAWPSITAFGFNFFTEPENGITHGFITMAAIVGTVYSSMLAIVLAAPVGVLIAVFLSETAPGAIKRPLGFVVEMLAAVPSVVYGMWGLFVVVPLVIKYVNPFLTTHFGGIPLFSDPSAAGTEYLTAGFVLAVMILPTIAAISRDVISTVPASQREAMLALGATRWETTWKVVVPAARSGIVGAILLGLGRAVGETMAVVFLIGSSQSFGISMTRIGTTIPATIALQYIDAGGLWTAGLMELALLLLGFSIALNVLARVLVWNVNRRYAA